MTPWLGPAIRNLHAAWDALLPVKSSYGQHREDAYLHEQLSRYNLHNGIYVDVGASHPSRISNTYLFYRQGSQGVTIEPNLEYVRLHQRFRPRDTVLAIGCAASAGVAKFRLSKTPVLSRFVLDAQSGTRPQALDGELWRHQYLPLLPLDLALRDLPFEWIYLLSVDVEGLDLDVLEGARETLPRVLFVCIEANDEPQRQSVDAFLGRAGFTLERSIACNLIYRNRSDAFEAYAEPVRSGRGHR